jgi:P-aminobenzoate N-oxygenase AurF
MSTHELYEIPAEMATWDVPTTGCARFTWEYDEGRDKLLALYQKGKDKQWDSTKRINWSQDVDPDNPMGLSERLIPIYGTPLWDRMSSTERQELGRHQATWQFSQFLHGEQGAMICAARIVESVPDLDSKFYSATQTMDEARHAETYARFLNEKVGMFYPINSQLKALLDSTLSDSRWDMPYLGMQVLIEGLAQAAFGVLRDYTKVPLVKQILAYVMQDEARHVAFGRIALRDYYKQLSSAELAEREEFVITGCWLMRNRLRGEEVIENLGLPREECMQAIEESPYYNVFRSLLFSRLVPCVRDIGLWSEKVQQTFEDMDVLDAVEIDLDSLMQVDEAIAERIDRKRFAAEEAARIKEVEQTIALGAQAS